MQINNESFIRYRDWKFENFSNPLISDNFISGLPLGKCPNQNPIQTVQSIVKKCSFSRNSQWTPTPGNTSTNKHWQRPTIQECTIFVWAPKHLAIGFAKRFFAVIDLRLKSWLVHSLKTFIVFFWSSNSKRFLAFWASHFHLEFVLCSGPFDDKEWATFASFLGFNSLFSELHCVIDLLFLSSSTWNFSARSLGNFASNCLFIYDVSSSGFASAGEMAKYCGLEEEVIAFAKRPEAPPVLLPVEKTTNLVVVERRPHDTVTKFSVNSRSPISQKTRPKRVKHLWFCFIQGMVSKCLKGIWSRFLRNRKRWTISHQISIRVRCWCDRAADQLSTIWGAYKWRVRFKGLIWCIGFGQIGEWWKQSGLRLRPRVRKRNRSSWPSW
jgi:hypothetical protein